MFAGWNERRGRRRAASEAKHLVGEARRILRKKDSHRIPEAVSADIESAIGDVESSLGGEDVEQTRQAMGKLDEKMDEHLSFARKSSLREYAESIGVAVAIALLLRAFVVEAFQIPSGSMIPTLEIGDHIFVSKFSYGVGIPFTNKKILRFGEPKRGDIIVFKFPLDQDVDYIKRVVGLPGETVELKKNQIFVNGRPMARERSSGSCVFDEGPRDCEEWVENLDGKVHRTHHEAGAPKDSGPFVIAPNNVFVMGDNRDNSNDSRAWGTVPEELIKGRALIVWWSRGPTEEVRTDGVFSWLGSVPGKIGRWFGAIRWRRFFSLVR